MGEETGFVGLGLMGEPMATNLVKAGFKVAVYNRTAERARRVAELGARVASRPFDAAEAGGVVVTMVADDRALEQLTTGADGFGERLGPGGIHLSMSTISPETSKRLSAWHAARGSQYVAAPVCRPATRCCGCEDVDRSVGPATGQGARARAAIDHGAGPVRFRRGARCRQCGQARRELSHRMCHRGPRRSANDGADQYSVEILEAAGFEVRKVEGTPSVLAGFTEAEVDRMAELEHGRWNVERMREGWHHGKPRDDSRKIHDCLVSWKELPDDIKHYDRAAVRAFPEILAKAGLEVRRISA